MRPDAFGAGVDRPITWYTGSTLSNRNWLHADELGSVIATSNGSGAATIYSYGPYGEPDATNGWSGLRFRYTGQIMLYEAQLYHYKARAYHPLLGRFLQTDPVGYEDDLNLYAYVGNDPLNGIDPTGSYFLTCDAEGNCTRSGRACEGNRPAHYCSFIDNDAAVALLWWNNGGKQAVRVFVAIETGRAAFSIVEAVLASNAAKQALARLNATAGDVAAWIGPGARVIRTREGNLIVESADGARRFRIDFSQRRGEFGGPHAQFEVRDARGNFRPAEGSPQHVYFGGD